mgnify:CR=1 FL=1
MAILSKKVMGFLYGMGAAVVIVGALFKLMHWPGAGPMLVIGLLTEAAIFALSAFEPVEHELDWSLVYPELAGGEAKLKDAKIDGELMASLGNSIKNFEGAAKGIAPTVDAMASQKKYAEEMVKASSSLEALNNLYAAQVDAAQKNADANAQIAENADKLKQQMQSMTSNISSLNAVYGGMLSAMQNKG